MKFEMAATLALTATTSAFVVPSVPLRTRVASSSASSTSMMAGERSKALPMLPQPPAVRREGEIHGQELARWKLQLSIGAVGTFCAADTSVVSGP